VHSRPSKHKQFRVRKWLAIGLFTLIAVALAAGNTEPIPAASSNDWSLHWQPLRLVNGAPVIFQAAPRIPLKALSGKWLGHEIAFSFDPASKMWYGIGGVSLETRPGSYVLQLTGASKDGEEISFQRKLIVERAKYPSIAVTVAHRFTEPSPEQVREINQDKTIKEDAFRTFNPERQWSGKFRPPVEARVSDVFGTRRTFNRKVQSMHQGLDFAVPAGTPVSALNSGTVLLARPLYFEGGCVVLDHGQGLLTLYLHLSDFKVKEGEHVAAGQEIGLSGASGRATGPHLHIAVRWQGVYLNPATLLTLRVP
jgi:murein DD-endopeptidase MepM/ murein hydrolase activator NlpD